MKLKEAISKDLNVIREIAEKSWRENYPGIISEEQIDYMLKMMYSEEEIASQLQNANYSYYFIQNERKENIGIMGIEKDYEKNTTKLHRLYLLKKVKGKGFGKFAIEKLKEIVTTFGNNRIILNVNKSNPAKEFYNSRGLKVYNEGVFDIGGGFVMDDFLMEIWL